MNNELSAKISADISGFVGKLNEAGRATTAQTSKMAADFNKVGKVIDDNAARLAKSSQQSAQQFTDQFSKASKQVQDLVKKAIDSGIKPKFEEMTKFLEKQGISVWGTKNQQMITQFSTHFAREYKNIQAVSAQTTQKVITDWNKVHEHAKKLRSTPYSSGLRPSQDTNLGTGRNPGFGKSKLPPPGAPPPGSPPEPPSPGFRDMLGTALSGYGTGGQIAGMLLTGAKFGAIGLAASAAALAVRKFSDEVAANVDRLQDMSRMVNISVESLSALEHVAIMNGANIEEFQRSLIRLNDQMQEAATGNSRRSVEVFRELGVAVTDANGKVRPTMHVFLDMADALEKMGETSKRTNLIMDLFGQQTGAKILKIMKDGSVGIKEAMQRAIDMGLVLDKEKQKMAEGYNKEVRMLGEQWRMFKMIIATEAMPIITRFIAKINELVDSIRKLTQTPIYRTLDRAATGVNQFLTGKFGESINTFKNLMTDQDPTHQYGDDTLTSSPNTVAGLLAGEKGSDIRGGSTKWTEQLEQMRRSFREQLNGLKEQEIALRKGAAAAREFGSRMRFEEEIKAARREGAPASVLRQMNQIFNEMNPKILAAADAMDKLMGKDFATEIKNRTRELEQGVEKIRDTMDDLFTSTDPGEKAFKGFTNSIEGVEKQIEDMLITARREEILGNIPGATEKVKELEAALQKVQELLSSDSMRRFEFDSKILDDMNRAHKNNVDTLNIELQASKAITGEQKVQVEVERALLMLKNSGVSAERLKSKELRDQLEIQKRIEQSIREQIAFNANIRTRQNSIQDMILEIQMNKAVTKEQRLQVELRRAELLMEREGITLTSERRAELEETVRAQHDVAEILRKQKDQVDTVMKSIDSAIENMQTQFADMWYNIFDPEAGSDWGKRFLKSVVQGWLRATSQFAGVMTNKLMEDLFKAVTGQEGGIREGLMSIMKDWFNVGQLSPEDQAKVDKSAALAKMKPEVRFDFAVDKFSLAVDKMLMKIDSGTYSGPKRDGLGRSSIFSSSEDLWNDAEMPAEIELPRITPNEDLWNDAEIGMTEAMDGALVNFSTDFVERSRGEMSRAMEDCLQTPVPSFFNMLKIGFNQLTTWVTKLFESIVGMMGFGNGGGGAMGGGGGSGIFSMLSSIMSTGNTGGMFGFGSAPSGVSGPSMANGGFFSMPQGGSSGGWGGALGGAMSGAQMGSSFGPWGTAIGGLLGGIAGFFMADGGYAPDMGIAGIVNQPMIAMGENSGQFEAVVPLPDNRSIPVKMMGNAGASEPPVVMPTPVTVNFLGDTVDPSVKGLTPEEAVEVVYADIRHKGGKLRDAIRNEIG